MKIATLEDVSDIADMGMKFVESTGYIKYADRATIENLIIAVINGEKNERIILFEPDVGFLAACVTPFLFGPHILATEMAWWVNPDHRGKQIGSEFLKAFEYWAKEKAGASMVSMSCLDDKLCKFYEKQGYKLYERAYMKVL